MFLQVTRWMVLLDLNRLDKYPIIVIKKKTIFQPK